MRRLVVALLCLACTACERRMQDMYDQPRLDPGERSTLFPDGAATRPPPDGSVAQSGGDTAQPRITMAALQRGRDRYAIYCVPCHSVAGDGDGPVVRRGFPAPPSFHQARLREADDRYLFDVITRGHGIMPSYGDRVPVEDRWAIVAYVRALQWSQHAAPEDLTPDLRAALPPAPGSPR